MGRLLIILMNDRSSEIHQQLCFLSNIDDNPTVPLVPIVSGRVHLIGKCNIQTAAASNWRGLQPLITYFCDVQAPYNRMFVLFFWPFFMLRYRSR